MPPVRQCPALFISAPASHQGKTSVTAGLARHFRNKGLRVRAFKAGPDFLDPMILERASANEVLQLDLWMLGENECRRLVYEAAADADVILVEGVMGLFDGTPSSADLACLLDVPVAFVINCSGMAETAHAVGYGLASYRPDLKIAGIVANNIASPRHSQMIQKVPTQRVPLLACLPRMKEATIPSRHLGLTQASELVDLDAMLDTWADAIGGTPLAELPPPISIAPAQLPPSAERSLNGVSVAIAQDNAFSFVYRENVKWLEEMGATVSRFSPLNDRTVPEADVLYLPGGYPELHLETLASNESMKASIRSFHQSGRTIYAECGGMLYLMETLIDAEQRSGSLVGLIAGVATMQKRLSALGYQQIELTDGTLRGHTFHYSKVEAAVTPSGYATKHPSGMPGEAIYRDGNLFATYVHSYFRSAPQTMTGILRGTAYVETTRAQG